MYKLLIVDDENETRKALCNYFPWEEHGFEVVAQFENGKQALDYIVQHSVDIVLSDIKMPVMSGLVLAEELSRLKSKVRVILLSGHTEFEYAKQALIHGVKDYIVKPAKYRELVSVFNRLKLEFDEDSASLAIESPSRVVEEEIYDYDEKVIGIVKRYVDEHYKEVQLIDVAQLVHLNPNYLSQYFKLKTGQKFSDYIIKIKMLKAAELLKDIDYKIYNISDEIGYSNPKNFTRTFKGYFGMSPNEFRRGNRGQDEK